MPQDFDISENDETPGLDLTQFGTLEEFDAAVAAKSPEVPEYPAIALEVRNHVPMVMLYSDEDTNRVLIKADQGIDTALMSLAEKLNFSDYVADELMALLMTGDENSLSLPALDLDQHEEINLDRLVQFAIQAAPQTKPTVEADAAVVAQLDYNWAIDVLASTREEIYNLLIAHVIRLADEFAIGNIQLRDHRHEARLVEKMAKELALGGVELIVL
jgi:hypothetical protein